MMFERSLKSNIDGIEHSLTFDQKKLAFEIMTSAFLFQYILMFGTTKIIFYMINAYPINICIDLDIAQLFFFIIKNVCIGEKLRFFKKKKTLAYQMFKILNTLYLPHTGMVSLTKVLRFELNTCLI